MGLSVTTVASGGLPVVDVSAIAPLRGTPVTETLRGLPVTKVAAGKPGLAVTFVSAGGGTAAPTIILSNSTVLETATVGTTVGTLSVANTYTGTPVFTLVDSAGGKFAISGTSLNTAAALDYETATTHNIIVAVSGITPVAANKPFTIAVIDVVEATAAAWNPLDADVNTTLTNSNLTATTATGTFGYSMVRATVSRTAGKFYSEHTIVEDNGFVGFMGIGLLNAAHPLTTGFAASAGFGFGYSGNGEINFNGAGGAIANIQPFARNDRVDQCVDIDNQKLWWRTFHSGVLSGWNNDILANQNPATNTGGMSWSADVYAGAADFYPAMTHLVYVGVPQVSTANFGPTFAGAPPSGFVAWGGSGGATGTAVNIVTDFGAVADGNWATTSVTSVAASTLIATSTPIFSAGSAALVGKSIVIGKINTDPSNSPGGGAPLLATITGWNSSSSINISVPASYTWTATPNVIVAWGTNNASHFQAFKDAYPGGNVTLTIPAGTYLLSSGNFDGLFEGLRTITVNATGATICGGTFSVSAPAQATTSGHSAATASVSAGATSVTLVTPSQVSRFVVGDFALMTGQVLQSGGYPSNQQLFEYLRIIAIDSDSLSPTYGKITFLTPLVNSYLSTWPLYQDEAGGALGYGGPATLYAMHAKFDHTAVINGLTVANNAQWGVSGRSLTFNNCTFAGEFGPHATMAGTLAFNNCTATNCTMELDKLVDSLSFTGCTWSGFSVQSASLNKVTIDSTTVTFTVAGSPNWLEIKNGSHIGTLAPTHFYGHSKRLDVSNSTISNFADSTTHTSGLEIRGGTFASHGIQTEFSMASSVLTVPPTYYQVGLSADNPHDNNGLIGAWMNKGGKLFFYDGNVGMLGSFTITDVIKDGSGVHATTDWAHAVFPVRTWPANGLGLWVHPAPICTFSGVTGCPEVVDLSNATVAGISTAGLPLYSFSKRTYGSVAINPYWQVWGRIKKVVVNVTTAYAGPFGGAVTATLAFGNAQIEQVNYQNTTWAPVIDLRTTGTRTFDATANTYPVSWTGAAGADSLPSMTQKLWCPGNFRSLMVDIVAAATTLPVYTVEVVTDQEFA